MTMPIFFAIRTRFAIFCSGKCGSAVAIKGSHPQKRLIPLVLARQGHLLWAAAAFTAGDVTVQNGDQLKVTYTVSA